MNETVATASPASAALRAELAIANQILFDQELNDGYGHVSVRHDHDPNRYVMLRDPAPGKVDSEDVIEFDLDSRSRSGAGGTCKERFIHGEIYKARPDVMAVVHSHAVDMILFSVVREPLRPIYQMSHFLGKGAPVLRYATCPKEAIF